MNERLKKSIRSIFKILFVFAWVALIAPYLLGHLGFYAQAQAQAQANTNIQTTQTPPIIQNCVTSYADPVARAAPAVVSIKTSKEMNVEQNPFLQDPMFRFFFGDPNSIEPRGQHQDNNTSPKETLQGLGSGVIVNSKGYILTNHHVVKEVDSIIVTLADGRSTEAKLIGSDPETDLAVLKTKLDKLPVISMGSSQKLRVGDIVLAIGNPFGFDQTVTQGIISATERTGMDIGIHANLLQTDASINPGNSGGPLINAAGDLVGINTAIYSRSGTNQGIGFAIPIDAATEVMNHLIEGKRIIRGYLGVMMAPLNPEIREAAHYKTGDGVYIRAVVRNSPAQKAGLLPGDVITKINEITIKDEKIGLKSTTALKPGKNYPIEVFRKGEYLTFVVTPAERNLEQKK